MKEFKEFAQPIRFSWKIAIMYYAERFGLDALKIKMNDEAHFEEMKEWLDWNRENGINTETYIKDYISNPDTWEYFLEELDDWD